MEQKEVRDELIIGRNPVMEALKAGRNIDTIFVSKGERQGSIGKIIATARDAGVLIKETDPKKLGFMCGNANHQGVIAKVAAMGAVYLLALVLFRQFKPLVGLLFRK